MTIRLLEDNLINKIAAGEVIERPASIVKELVENSIDAGAGKISVSIVNGGIDKIEVEDDGGGIGSEELPVAFLRHATSKISREEDLYNIYTMGFRGEALPSIASVSKIDIYSKKANSDGVFARIEGGVLLEQQVHPCPPGTRIIIKDLFYNTPARKKFLKSPVTEGNNIFDFMCKYALARPDISFTYNNEKRLFFKTPGSGKLRDALIAVYGSDINENLIEAFYQGETYSLSGLISTPEVSRRNRKNQLFFVNGRPIRSAMLYKALDNAYKGLLISREHPIAILEISMPADLVDVNVHPQKTEVRFKDEKALFKMVSGVLGKVLKDRDFNFTDSFVGENREELQYREANEKRHLSYLPGPGLLEPTSQPYSIPKSITDGPESEKYELINYEPDDSTGFNIIGQCFNSYILVERDDSLWLVDQHAAHERIMYTRLKEQYEHAGREVSQVLAFPLALELPANQIEKIEQNKQLLDNYGFSLEVIGYNSILIRATPGFVIGKEQEVVLEMLDLLNEKDTIDFNNKVITMMSCKKAIKAGSPLNRNEMEKLFADLLTVPGYKNCPHGRPTLIRLDHAELDRMFKR